VPGSRSERHSRTAGIRVAAQRLFAGRRALTLRPLLHCNEGAPRAPSSFRRFVFTLS
jgi:hypothetical protein